MLLFSSKGHFFTKVSNQPTDQPTTRLQLLCATQNCDEKNGDENLKTQIVTKLKHISYDITKKLKI